MEINWFGQGRIEYFGIAPNRTIWHSSASSGWVVMPNNGLADEVDGAMAREPHYRTIAVWAGGNLWCSTDYGYGYSWNPWHQCDLNNYI
ncbi:hypothetical protein [Micromonospora sp. NPDC006431]|uniref:hypothetical protein n=1 Tax=Micromonospora sp. NPDC006431 TaxID=3364235 RepID=UPI003679106F